LQTGFGHQNIDANAIRGSNQSGLRAHNERLVLSMIRQRGPLAKADIARASGLSAQTVSVIMRSLEAEGFLVKGDPVRGKVGQPSVPMALMTSGAYFLGLKVGRRSVELILTDFLGKVMHRLQKTHSFPHPKATLDFAVSAIDALLAKLTPQQRDRVAGLGIAMPFQLWEWAEILGVDAAEMDAWRGADLREDLAKNYDFPIYRQNDASAACGAELVFGTSDTPPDFLYFYVGYFVGGGVVLNGGLYTGRSGNAGALGPLQVTTPQGGAQLIDLASLSLLESKLRLTNLPTEQLWGSTKDWDLDATILDDWINAAANGLSQAIVSACSVIDFELVMIDGWLPEDVRQALTQCTIEKMKTLPMAGLKQPEIREGTVGSDARALGAASLPLSDRFLLDASA